MPSFETPREELIAEIERLQHERVCALNKLLGVINERDRLKAHVRSLERLAMDQNGELYQDRFHAQMHVGKQLIDRIEQLENEVAEGS